MKDTEVDSPAQRLAVPGDEPYGEDCGDGHLADQAERHHFAQHVTQVGRDHGLGLQLGGQPGPQADPAGDDDQDERGQRHDAQPTDLDEQDDHYLTEHRPVRLGVDHDQAGHADCGGGGEQSREPVRAVAFCCGQRGAEQ
ncbi:hypothetical protein GCM10020220_093870 [Nonomuraea rubra]